jgi:LysR family nitrogen assimilation transcriptional regulator
MDLQQLRYFLRVVEMRSFTRAAASLHIAQPAVTRQMRLLEEELGVQLLLRHSRGTEPTEPGARLRDGAELLFRLLDAVRADVVASSAAVSGTLRIGFPPSLGEVLVASAVSTFRERFPNVLLNLDSGYTHVLRDALLGDRLDLAVVSSDHVNPLLTSIHLCDEQLWILRAHGEAGPTPHMSYTFAQIAGLALIQPSKANTLRQQLEAMAQASGLALRVVVEAESLHMIKDLVRRGVGAHIAPYSGIAPDIERAEFNGGPVQGLAVSRFLARRIDRPATLALTRFSEVLIETMVATQAGTGGAMTLPGQRL